jgi:hypothetical protein
LLWQEADAIDSLPLAKEKMLDQPAQTTADAA